MGAAGNPIVWSLTVFPFLGLSILVNLGWLIIILFNVRRDAGKLLWIVIVTIAWIAANRYDAFRQFDG
jgi:hypothetical protein